MFLSTPHSRQITMGRQFIQFFLLVATASVPVFAVRSAVAQTSGGTDSEAASGDSKPAAKPPKIRQRVTLKLPDEYRSKDADKDGQIGMYEWSRTDYATFRKLDLNGDGFLTPLELSRPGRSRRSTSAVVTRSSEQTSTFAAALPTVESSTAGAPAAPTAGKSEAERQFELIDRDQNEKITEEEFQKSTLTRIKFKNAGIPLSFPVQRDEFLRLYPASK
jgi:hypothetical protein